MFKRKCVICKVRDKTNNLNYGCHGIYTVRYFHNSCVEEVICDPVYHGHAKVDRALWCHDVMLEKKHSKMIQKKYEEDKAKNRHIKVHKAQEQLECLR